jgi:hypothetical protein
MNAAKTLVWIMSGMLVALLGVLIVGLSLGWHKDNSSPLRSVDLAGERAFELLDLRQPIGTTIEHVAETNGWIAITLTGGGVPPRIVLIDPSSGSIVGEIAVNASGAFPSTP